MTVPLLEEAELAAIEAGTPISDVPIPGWTILETVQLVWTVGQCMDKVPHLCRLNTNQPPSHGDDLHSASIA